MTVGIGVQVLFFLVFTTVFVQERGWRGITPLHSTREDVERLIGPPMIPSGITYDLKTERVNVVYSDGACEKGQPSEWNVPRGTVIGITIYPQTKLMLSDLRIDLSLFEKVISPHNPDSVFYNDEENGISIDTQSNGEVVKVYYHPTRKDSYLRCPTAKQLSFTPPKFDEFTNLKLSDEKARLDNFAKHLDNQWQLNGYIIVYAPPRARSGEAAAHAKRAKDYLITVHRINEARIVTIDGGCRKRADVELYSLPNSMPPPTPVADCK